MKKPLFPESLGFVGKSGLMRFFAIQFACLCWNAAFSQRFSIPVFRCAETQNKEATCLSPSGFLCRNCTQTHAVRLQYHYIHGVWMRQTNSLDGVRRDSWCVCPWRWMEGVRRAGFGEKEGVPSSKFMGLFFLKSRKMEGFLLSYNKSCGIWSISNQVAIQRGQVTAHGDLPSFLLILRFLPLPASYRSRIFASSRRMLM